MIRSKNNTGYFPQMPVCDKHLSVEVNSDFSLPDYQPEIRRLLSSRVCVLPPSEYIGNSAAELSGELSYRILYLGADGKLYSAALGDTYSLSVPFEFDSHSVNTDEITLICTAESESIGTRVLGPRKLNVRTRLSCHARAFSPSLYTPTLAGPHNDTFTEDRILDIPSIHALKCVSEPTPLTELIPIDPQVDNIRIVDHDSKVMIGECTALDEKINVKGEVLLKLLYCNDAQSELPLSMTRKLPFSITIPCEQAEPAFECSASGHAYDEKLTIAENGISVELLLTVCVRAQRNTAVSYINDAYSTERRTECENEIINVTGALKCTNANLTQNEIFKLEDIKLPPDAKIVDISSECTVQSYELENGRLHIRGKSDYQLIYYHDEEFSSKELSAPWHFELECRGSGIGALSEVSVSVLSCIPACRARHDGERLFVDGELCFSIMSEKRDRIKLLSKMVFLEPHEKRSGEMLLCFPEKDAELWDIAKHYGESERKICSQNSIPEGEVTVKKKFLII